MEPSGSSGGRGPVLIAQPHAAQRGLRGFAAAPPQGCGGEISGFQRLSTNSAAALTRRPDCPRRDCGHRFIMAAPAIAAAGAMAGAPAVTRPLGAGLLLFGRLWFGRLLPGRLWFGRLWPGRLWFGRLWLAGCCGPDDGPAGCDGERRASSGGRCDGSPVPAGAAAPAKSAPPGVAAPVPTRAAPSGIVPGVPPAPDELRVSNRRALGELSRTAIPPTPSVAEAGRANCTINPAAMARDKANLRTLTNSSAKPDCRPRPLNAR